MTVFTKHSACDYEAYFPPNVYKHILPYVYETFSLRKILPQREENVRRHKEEKCTAT
jgi:hypothetical protein